MTPGVQARPTVKIVCMGTPSDVQVRPVPRIGDIAHDTSILPDGMECSSWQQEPEAASPTEKLISERHIHLHQPLPL